MVAKALGIIPPPKFSQATIVTGALLGAWVFWLLVNNKAGTYWSILTGSGAAQQPSAGYPGSGSGSGSGAQAAPHYLINPIPSIGFPGVTSGF